MSEAKLWQAFIEGACRGYEAEWDRRAQRDYWDGKTRPKAGEQRLVVDRGNKREGKQ